MPRPEFVTEKDVDRWSNNIDHDPQIGSLFKRNYSLREVLYCGLWLSEELEKIGCPFSIIHRIQWTAGQLSFGRDPWEVHQDILNKYKGDELVFEEDPNEVKN